MGGSRGGLEEAEPEVKLLRFCLRSDQDQRDVLDGLEVRTCTEELGGAGV